MKKQVRVRSSFLAICLLFSCISFSQQTEGYAIPKSIPPFNMLLSDGVTYYNASNVQQGKPLMIVYFDPECEHCQHFTADLIKNISKFNNVQIVMICDAPGIPPLKKFTDRFGLSKYQNIKAGTEGLYHSTMNFYHVDITPFTALYNTKGELISYYRNVPKIHDLVVQLSK